MPLSADQLSCIHDLIGSSELHFLVEFFFFFFYVLFTGLSYSEVIEMFKLNAIIE